MHTSRISLGLALLALGALAACAAPRGPSSAQLKAGAVALERTGAVADPGLVAARDIGFAKAARENGQWFAFGEYAASGALLDTADGFLTPGTIAGLPAPDKPFAWGPTAVWSSCDGSVAVSFGRYVEAGLVGSYVTAWERTRGEPYRWAYTTRVPDDPQPAPPEEDPLLEGEDVIVVGAMDAIDARTADCPRGDAALPPPPAPASAPAARSEVTRSADSTLHWYWEHGTGGGKRVVVEYLRDGSWQRPLDLIVQPGS